jgi:hypothetical protein
VIHLRAPAVTTSRFLYDSDGDRPQPAPQRQEWTLRTVAAILANPRYTGRQVWNRQRTQQEMTPTA